jgi:hypothetical protein
LLLNKTIFQVGITICDSFSWLLLLDLIVLKDKQTYLRSGYLPRLETYLGTFCFVYLDSTFF